jgi:hypothetical protein
MRQSLLFARGLALVVALVAALPIAAAAPARHPKPKGKPKHAAPAATDSASSTPDGTDQSSPKPEDSAPPKPEDSALANAPQKTPPAPETPVPSASTAASASLASGASGASDVSDAPPETDGESSQQAAHEALGRREAARLAAGRSEVGVSLSMDVGNRRFEYSDELGSQLRPYKLAIAPMLSFGLEAYPLATSDVPVLRDLGFRGRFSRAFALDSTTPEGAQIDTSWTRFGGEIRQRLLVPGRHPLEFGASFGADASYFVMSSQSPIQALLPSARTIALRFGLDGRVLLAGRFSAMLGVAYLAVTSPGEIYEHFRDPQVAGVDGELAFALALVPGLEARLSGRYTRYFATFQPEVGDPYVAGGALDQQLQAGLGVRYAH